MTALVPALVLAPVVSVLVVSVLAVSVLVPVLDLVVEIPTPRILRLRCRLLLRRLRRRRLVLPLPEVKDFWVN